MGEVLVRIMESPVAPLVLLVLFWLAYRDLRKQINGTGRVGRGIKDYLLETEADEAQKVDRLTTMRDLAEMIAEKFYSEKKDIEFRRINFSKTSLQPSAWKDCSPRDRLEWTEAAKRVLTDKEIMQMLMNRAAG